MRKNVYEIVSKEGSSKYGNVVKVENGFYSTVDVDSIIYNTIEDLIENLPEHMKLIDDLDNDKSEDFNINTLIDKIVEVEMTLDDGLYDNYHNVLHFKDDLKEEIESNGLDDIIRFYKEKMEFLDGIQKNDLQKLIFTLEDK